MNFDNAVEAVRKQNEANDPVRLAKLELEPTRLGAVAGLKEFDKVATKLHPVFDDGAAKLHMAASVGVNHRGLETQLRQAHEVITGGRSNFATLIERIENLTAHDLGQDAYLILRYQGMLRAARASIDALPGLAKGVTALVAELEEVLAQHVPQAAPIMTADPQVTPRGVTVETAFDPRR